MKLKEIEEISKWLNEWGDYQKYPQTSENGKRTEFGDGYMKAIQDIFNKFKVFEEKLHLVQRKWKPWKDEEEEKLKELYNNGYPYIEISKILNRSLSSTSGRISWLCQLNILDKRQKDNNGRKGKKNEN